MVPPSAAPPASASAPGGHAPTATLASDAGTVSTIKEGVPAPRRIVGSGSNTELRAQIRRERKLKQMAQEQHDKQQHQQQLHHAHQPQQQQHQHQQQQQQQQLNGTAASSAMTTSNSAQSSNYHLHYSRPASALSTRPPSVNSAAGAAQGHPRRTASASSSGAPTHQTAVQGTSTGGVARAQQHHHQQQQQHLLQPSTALSGRTSSMGSHAPAPTGWTQEAIGTSYHPQQEHTAFSMVSQNSTHGHGNGRTSSQGHTQTHQIQEQMQHAWPKGFEPEVHSSVIDAIIANFQSKYTEAALKCKDWQAYAAKLKTQSRALGVENRLLRQLNERQQEQVQALRLKLDATSDERDRSDLERARLESRVEELEALLMSQEQLHLRAHSHDNEYGRGPSQQFEYDYGHLAPGNPSSAPSPVPSQAHLDVAQRPIRQGPARMQAARLLQEQRQHYAAQQMQHHSQNGRFVPGSLHQGHLSASRSGDADPSELYQTAIDAATAAFETGLDLSVPSAPQWDEEHEHEHDTENQPRFPGHLPLSTNTNGPQPGRVLRRSGNLPVPGGRAQGPPSASQRSGSRKDEQRGFVPTTDDDEDSMESSESESESESERQTVPHQRAESAMRQQQQHATDRPPTPTGYQQTGRESSGFRSFPSPEDVYDPANGGGGALANGQMTSPSPHPAVPMHMHSSPPFQYQLHSTVNRGAHARSNAHSHQASLIGTIAASQAAEAAHGRYAAQSSPQEAREYVERMRSHRPSGSRGMYRSSENDDPAPPSPILGIDGLGEDDEESGRASPVDILELDAERREEVGPSPLIGYHDVSPLAVEAEGVDFDIATGSPMGGGNQFGLGLRIGHGHAPSSGEMGMYQPLRLDSSAIPVVHSSLPPSDSLKTLVDGEAELQKAGRVPDSSSVGLSNRPSASLRSNGAQRYTVISPARTKGSNGGATQFSFSSIAPPAAATTQAAGSSQYSEHARRPSAPPVTSLGGSVASNPGKPQGNLARQRSSNSTDNDLARSSASVPTLPFSHGSNNPNSSSAGHSDVPSQLQQQQRSNAAGLLAPNSQQQGRLRAHSTISEAATVKETRNGSRGQVETDEELTGPESQLPPRREGSNGGGSKGSGSVLEGGQGRPMSLNLPVTHREANVRLGSHGPAAGAQTTAGVTASNALHRPPSRSASRNSNLSIASYQVGGANVGAATNGINRTSAGQLSVHSIGGEQLARARNRSRASSHSVHDAIPVVVKDDVFSDAGHGLLSAGTANGGITPTGQLPSPLYGSSGASSGGYFPSAGASNSSQVSASTANAGGGHHSANVPQRTSGDPRQTAGSVSHTSTGSASASGATLGGASSLLHAYMHTSAGRSESKLSTAGSSQSLAASSVTSRSSGAEAGNQHGRGGSSGGPSYLGGSSGAASVAQYGGHTRVSTGMTSMSGGGRSNHMDEADARREENKENDMPPALVRGSSASTLASTQHSMSPNIRKETHSTSSSPSTGGAHGTASARSSTSGGPGLHHPALTHIQEAELRLTGRVSSSGLAALSPSISRAGRGGVGAGAALHRLGEGGNLSFSRTPMNGGTGYHVRADDGDESGDGSRYEADGYGQSGAEDGEEEYDDGEADGVGPHRQLYARMRAALEPAHLAKFEKYVHRYDALDIPLEGPRGLINRVRKLLLRGEPDLPQRPDRLRLMRELLREFEALVRVEIPATAQ
ncbi:hypothetical protein CF326_g3469 [Tilletia indica]|nr:hypothetical protein CF326_g3469 [Tilletia indica]